MIDRGEAARRPLRAPMPRRTRRRWLIAAGVAACWVLLLGATGSVVAGTVILLLGAVVAAMCVAGLRALGVNGSHPWVQGLRSRPWRDGQEVFQLALRHLPEVFVITPGGSLLAPNDVEVRLSPRDFRSLREVMDLSLVDASATEAYAEAAVAHNARPARQAPPRVQVVEDPAVAPGRYRLRQASPLGTGSGSQAEADHPLVPVGAPAPGGAPAAGLPADAAPPAAAVDRRAPRAPGAAAGGWPHTHDGYTHGDPDAAPTVMPGQPTVAERRQPPVPLLRLVTGGSVAQTRESGARAGRGEVELALPMVPTISREHARFTFGDGRWWVENLGRNGLSLNGVPLTAQHPLCDGDSLRWGTGKDAPVSRVEIG